MVLLGVSACLLGAAVRWNGGDKRGLFCAAGAEGVAFHPICPEVGCGLGIPREPMRLVGECRSPRLFTIYTAVDYTRRMLQWAEGEVQRLEQLGVCGFVFKGGSPSCGKRGVPVYNKEGEVVGDGAGVFAAFLMERLPLCPSDEAEALQDPAAWGDFLERCAIMSEWRKVVQGRRGLAAVLRFHAEQGGKVRFRSKRHYAAMAALLAQKEAIPLPILYERYQDLLVDLLCGGSLLA